MSHHGKHRIVHGQKRMYGWKKSVNVPEEFHHVFALSKTLDTVKEVDLRNMCPPVYNQLSIGSCTANSLAGAYEFDEIKQKEKNQFTPSRLFIYYNEREIEGTVDEDSGAQIYDGVKVLLNGVCPETLWPYDITKFTDKPPTNCYEVSKNHVAKTYKKIKQNLQQIKQCLINGFPIAFGINVYESFESDEVVKTGMVPMPKSDEQCVGGHAILLVGFISDKKKFIVRNSWGDSWGDKGYFYLDFDYVLDPKLADDFWCILSTQDS